MTLTPAEELLLRKLCFMLALVAWAVSRKTGGVVTSIIHLVIWLAPHEGASRRRVAVFDIEATREASVPVRETLDGGRSVSELRSCHGGERSGPPTTVRGSKKTVLPIKTVRLSASHRRKGGTSLASAAASSAPALTASVIPASPVERLCTAAPEVVRTPAISLVLGCMKRLLHGERDLLHRMGLCYWRSMGDGQGRDLHLQSRLVLHHLIECWRDALVDGGHEAWVNGAICHTGACSNRAYRFGCRRRSWDGRGERSFRGTIFIVPEVQHIVHVVCRRISRRSRSGLEVNRIEATIIGLMEEGL